MSASESRMTFGSAVSRLLTGSTLAFVIGYALKPVVLRLYPAAAFGEYEAVSGTGQAHVWFDL